MNPVDKIRQDQKEKTKQKEIAMQSVHNARQRLISALGRSMSGNTNDTMAACNKLFLLPVDERPDFIIKNWSQVHLKKAEAQLHQLQTVEAQLRTYA